MVNAKSTRSSKIVRPSALRQGDKIGLIAPASSFNHERFSPGATACARWATSRARRENFDRGIYFAGPWNGARVSSRSSGGDDIAALICVRGGYGSNYLLEKLHYGMFAMRPKILLGCSDITSLLTAIHDRTGLIGFHGPMVAKDIADGTFDAASRKNALQGAASWQVETSSVEVLRPGKAAGRLYGGCLSMMVASLGTPFEIQTDDAILFIDDKAKSLFALTEC